MRTSCYETKRKKKKKPVELIENHSSIFILHFICIKKGLLKVIKRSKK